MLTNDEALAALPTDDRITGKTALVTGSTSGIGEAIARVLAASGAEVLVTGRNQDRANTVVSTIIAAGGKAHALTVDLATPPAVIRNFVTRAQAVLGGHVDILVNNAGVYPVGATEELSDEDLESILAANIRSPHVLVSALAPAMVARGSGSIVNIGSWTARVGLPATVAYPASKAALEQLTRGWSAEYGPKGVRVNTVSPGITSTPGNEGIADAISLMTRATVAGRPARPVDIAYAVRFAVSDEAAFLHGTTIDVDGGMTAARLG